ncbi:DUF1769 family protein [Schizosaccharomyces japonicus yFS275]|uniref:DUF1769 family protein n=1 Tax=Schizosaccharomyces japonicus (strain yFS275 / FY16936) TaxID=402676 RepID=B6K0Q5_SCHJY|nr:DUF1769 family protein [Schizosaccharomyces japonicus yFS275]EEB07526.1 DUF1769 family protein [Schizosaccharomyces japonicus yFS275]
MKVRVRVGPDPEHTQIAWVNHEGRPTEIDGPYWVGRILVRIRDFSGITPDGSAPKRDSEYFKGRSRKFQIQAEGRFKKEYNGDQVIYGTQFDHMISHFPESAFRAGMRIAKYIDPAVYYDKNAKSPYIMSPFVACVNTLSAWPAPSRMEDAVISLVEADAQDSDSEPLPDVSDTFDETEDFTDFKKPEEKFEPKNNAEFMKTHLLTSPPAITVEGQDASEIEDSPRKPNDFDELSLISTDSGNTTTPRHRRQRYWSFAGFNDNARFADLNKTSGPSHPQNLDVPSAVRPGSAGQYGDTGGYNSDEDEELLLHRHITNTHKDFSTHVKNVGLYHKQSLEDESEGTSSASDDTSADDERLQRYFTALELQVDKRSNEDDKKKKSDALHKLTHPSLKLGKKLSAPKLIKRMSIRRKKKNHEDSTSDTSPTTSTSNGSPVKHESKKSAPRRSLDRLIRFGSIRRHHHHKHEDIKEPHRSDSVPIFPSRKSWSSSRPYSTHSSGTSPRTSTESPLIESKYMSATQPPSRKSMSYVEGQSTYLSALPRAQEPSEEKIPEEEGDTVSAKSAKLEQKHETPQSGNLLQVPNSRAVRRKKSGIPKPSKHIPSESTSLDACLGPWRFGNPKVDPIEDNSFIFGDLKSVKERRKYFSSSLAARENFYFDRDVVYCMSFFAPYMDFNTFNLSFGPIRLNVNRSLNSEGKQPIRYMMREKENEKAIMFVVDFDLVEDDDKSVLEEQARNRELIAQRELGLGN